MKLNIYKNQTTVEKTYEVPTYDIMWGTVEDLLNVIAEADLQDMTALGKTILENRGMINELLLDIFGGEGLTESELRRTKVTELVGIFIELFAMVKTYTSRVGSKN